MISHLVSVDLSGVLKVVWVAVVVRVVNLAVTAALRYWAAVVDCVSVGHCRGSECKCTSSVCELYVGVIGSWLLV